MAKVLQCIYKSWPCDDLDQVYGKVNMGCLCIWIGKTVKMSFEGKSQQEIGKWTEYWRFWKKKMAQGLICPCTGVKYHNIQTCLLVYAADLRWAFTGPLVLWLVFSCEGSFCFFPILDPPEQTDIQEEPIVDTKHKKRKKTKTRKLGFCSQSWYRLIA